MCLCLVAVYLPHTTQYAGGSGHLAHQPSIFGRHSPASNQGTTIMYFVNQFSQIRYSPLSLGGVCIHSSVFFPPPPPSHAPIPSSTLGLRLSSFVAIVSLLCLCLLAGDLSLPADKELI